MTATLLQTEVTRLRESIQALYRADLPKHLERRQWDSERIAVHQRDALRSLLTHAIEHSPFHRRRLAGVDPGIIELNDIRRLPVMRKIAMMDSLDEVFTDRRLHRPMIDDAIARTESQPMPILDTYTALASGGSSGHRGLFIFDRTAWAGFMLSVTRSLIARVEAAGGPPPGGLRIAMVCAPSAVHATGSASAWTSSGDVPIHYLAVPATLPIAEIVQRLNALRPSMLCGYPSVLARLAVENSEGRLRIAPASVTTTSETVVPELRRVIADGFAAPIVDVFGSSEGLVGTTAPDDEVFVFSSDMCIVELVDADGNAVPPGEPSVRVLITNLYNHVQPLIRYELEDSFVQQPDAPDHGHLRAKVRGRCGHVLGFGDLELHPIVIDDVMERVPGALDYQVRQTREGMDVDVLAMTPVDSDRIGGELRSAVASAGLPEAVITVRIVQKLERMQDSGKIQRFIPTGTRP